MAKILTMGAVLLLFCSITSHAQSTNFSTNTTTLIQTEATAEEVGMVYGFFLGQDHLLNAIEQKFPHLKTNIAIAKLQFDSNFIAAITNMDYTMSCVAPDWETVRRGLSNTVDKAVGQQVITSNWATNFIRMVELRAKGDIASPIIETLLTFHPSYITEPHREFNDGFKVCFKSDGAGKAKGVCFHLDYPKSWLSVEAKHQSIARKFVSQNGRGFAVIMIAVRPEEKLTDKEIQKMISEATSSESKETLPAGASFIAGGDMKHDGRPGFYQKYSIKQKQLDHTVTSIAVAYTVFYPTSVVQIQCQVNSTASEGDILRERFERFEPLFKLVANSLVIEN